MKKAIAGVLVVVLLASGLLGGCGEVTVTGSGNLTTKTFNFSNFNKVEAASGFQVEMNKSSRFISCSKLNIQRLPCMLSILQVRLAQFTPCK